MQGVWAVRWVVCEGVGTKGSGMATSGEWSERAIPERRRGEVVRRIGAAFPQDSIQAACRTAGQKGKPGGHLLEVRLSIAKIGTPGGSVLLSRSILGSCSGTKWPAAVG